MTQLRPRAALLARLEGALSLAVVVLLESGEDNEPPGDAEGSESAN